MFAYPEKARYGRPIPKTKVFEKSGATSSIRKRFAAGIDKLVWEYKLSPETVNLPARDGMFEIQIISASLKSPDLDTDLLRVIDQAIPHPILFEVEHGDRVRTVAAYKRRHETSEGAWVVGEYFEGPKRPRSAARQPLPLALDLAGLYEALLRTFLLPARRGESLRDQVERLGRFRVAQGEMRTLESRIKREKQFARQVDLERELRTLRKAWHEELQAVDAQSG